jgi:hypothetical protein
MRVALSAASAFLQLLAVNVLAQALPPSSNPLLGAWEAISRSSGGLGATISFGAENSMSFTMGAMVDMKYRRSGDSLFVTSSDGALPPASIAFVNDTLVVTRGSREQRETRLGVSEGADPLVGRWTYKHYTGVPAYEEYTADGTYHLRVPIRTLTGTYTTAGNDAMLHLMGDGGGDREVKFAIVADTLALTWNGQTTRYLRAAPLGR